MEKANRIEIEKLTSACARIALWLADELEPLNSDVAEADLDDIYELAVAGERKLREWLKSRSS